MSSNHCLWLAHQLEKVAIKRGLHDTVIKLDDQHVLLFTTQSFRDQLAGLNLVIVEPLFVFYMIFRILQDRFAIPFLSWNHPNIATKHVEPFFDDIFIPAIFFVWWLFMVLEPWI